MPADPTPTQNHADAALSDVPRVRPTIAMGLQFRNPLGLAAGFDRTGRRIPVLMRLGFGHIEVGTLTPTHANVCPAASAEADVPIGVNIGSEQKGISQQVIGDYLAMLANVWDRASYVVANLSSPFHGRTGDTPGVETLLEQLATRWLDLDRRTERYVPLLVKVSCGPDAAPARAINVVRDVGLSGVVLASATLQQLSAVRNCLEGGTVIAVGGIASAADVRARLSAGAALVQVHTALARGGAGTARRILAELNSGD